MQDEEIARRLATRAPLLEEAGGRARRYLERLAERPVAPDAAALQALAALSSVLPEEGRDAALVIAELDEIGAPATLATAGPRFFGFVNGGALPAALAAAWILAAWDQNAALGVMSPTAARLEEIALGWVVELLHLPIGTGGGFVSGASMANTTCLAAARDAVLARVGWDAGADGLLGAPSVQVLVGAEAHTTLHKALGLVGLGRERVTRLATDEEGRILPSGLPRITAPAILCLQAGNVNGGASDPFPALVGWAHDAGAWVHVDGAFGLWAAASPPVAHEVAGVEEADSWATDAHKWLNTTYDCGIALVREADDLERAMRAGAAYLPLGGTRDPMRFTPQASQRARGAEVWAVLSSLGREGLSELVAGSCAHARRFAEALAAAGHTVLCAPHLNQAVVDFGGAERNATVIAALQEEGTCWFGPTSWRGRSAMRISVSCWATSSADVEASLAAILAVAANPSSAASARLA